jgi:hypothetical protein
VRLSKVVYTTNGHHLTFSSPGLPLTMSPCQEYHSAIIRHTDQVSVYHLEDLVARVNTLTNHTNEYQPLLIRGTTDGRTVEPKRKNLPQS